MFWLQVESDSLKVKYANAYLEKFKNFIATVRGELQVPDLPVVASPVVWRTGKKVDVVNQALQRAGHEIPFCTCIDPLEKISCFGVQIAGNDDCVSPENAAGVLDIGQRMGLAFPVDSFDKRKP